MSRLRAAGCVFAEEEARLLLAEATNGRMLVMMIDRRAGGLPLEQVLGWVEFCGRRYAVEPGVFVPRRRSQLLAREAVMRTLARPVRAPVVVDLCCGCGAIGLAAARVLPAAQLYAVDIDPVAVACARRNVGRSGGSVFCGDLVDPLPDALRGHVDVMVANAPYVPSAEIALMPSEARDHEPWVALDGGADGLAVQRRVIAAAPSWLAPGGIVLVETSERQAPGSLAAMGDAGLAAELVRWPELDATVVVGTAPATPS